MGAVIAGQSQPLWRSIPRGHERTVPSPGGAPGSWRLVCVLALLPIAAIAHHAVFFRATCMLNPFGPGYDLATIQFWLSSDPSLLVASVAALALYFVGRRSEPLRWLALCFVIAFMPLALWIWDIPGTGRMICMHLHDSRVLLGEDLPLKSRHLYLLGMAVHPLLCGLGWRRGLAWVSGPVPDQSGGRPARYAMPAPSAP